jgi:hypothetical protein
MTLFDNNNIIILTEPDDDESFHAPYTINVRVLFSVKVNFIADDFGETL